mgnify:CR=1 FL=1
MFVAEAKQKEGSQEAGESHLLEEAEPAMDAEGSSGFQWRAGQHISPPRGKSNRGPSVVKPESVGWQVFLLVPNLAASRFSATQLNRVGSFTSGFTCCAARHHMHACACACTQETCVTPLMATKRLLGECIPVHHLQPRLLGQRRLVWRIPTLKHFRSMKLEPRKRFQERS